MSIPVTASELEPFTPSSLASIAAPPVFTLRPATGRTLREYRSALRREGLVYHAPEEIRAEIRLALAALWTPELYAAHVGRLEAVWAAEDRNENLPEDQRIALDREEVRQIADLLDRVQREWPALRGMTADNVQFMEDSLKVAAAMFVAGWSNVDVAYVREAGRVPLETLDQVEGALDAAEEKAIADGVKEAGPVGRAFMELCGAVSQRLNLTRGEEKNSPSPSPSSSDPNGSMTTPSARTAARGSKASASSGRKKTRRT